MLRDLKSAFHMLFALTLLTGGLYPLLVTVLAQGIFPWQANGSLIRVDGGVVGSELIGQSFTKPESFWGRPSATAPTPYNAAASGGSNFGPLHPDLKKSVSDRVRSLQASGTPASAETKVPIDLVTTSASGLDPHITPAAAEFQVSRIAKSRKMSQDQVRALIGRHTEPRQFGVLGEPRVNVLRLNRALDASSQQP